MNFYQILAIIVISAIAIRISFKFDMNRFLENRRKIKIDQLKNICPHVKPTKVGDKFAFESFFSSPLGTMKWICSQCGCIVESEDDVNRIGKQYLKNPDLVFKKQKKFIKKAKKLKII